MTFFLSPAEWSAVLLSVKVALAATLLGLPVALGAGSLLARGNMPGQRLCDVVLNLPLVMPPVVTGYLLLVALGPHGFAGRMLERLGLRIVFDWKGAALAAAVMALPLMIRSIRVAVAGVDERLLQASRTLGAGPLETWCRITLPLAWHGIVGALVLGFARSLGEFGATIMIAGNIPGSTRTIPLAIYTSLHEPEGWGNCYRLVLVSVLIAAASLAVADALERRGGVFASARPPA